MPFEDTYITLVIHSTDRAESLAGILKSHDIEASIEDVVVDGVIIKSARRVRIKASDLPHALKITESGDSYSPALAEMKMAGMSGNLLIPVDFSESSSISVHVGFALARRFRIKPVIMHCYVAPIISPLVADTGIENMDLESEEVMNAQTAIDIRKNARKLLDDFEKQIIEKQKIGEYPDVKFSTTLLEGVAEEVILEYCKVNNPLLVVMATRGKHRKEEELIGSVTAEVLDSSRTPVFTVPEHYKFRELKEIRNLILFCNLDEQDVKTLDQLMRMFKYPECRFILVPAMKKVSDDMKRRLYSLKDFFESHFPASEFKVEIPFVNQYREGIDRIINDYNVDLLIIPNKKTNIFSRIFHPTIAHKFLFERDMPMLVLPV